MRRFISSDTEIALGKNVGNNTYAYCDNNPISNIDVFGEWTLSLTFGYELGYFLNVYSGTSISIDGHGNIAVQKVYTENKGRECIAGLNLNICLSTSIQWTGLDKVANLEGEGGIIGLPAVQIGPQTIGVDLVNNKYWHKADTKTGYVKGIALSTSIGVSQDLFHIGNLRTETTWSKYGNTKNIHDTKSAGYNKWKSVAVAK